jgi:dihydrofolate reductase
MGDNAQEEGVRKVIVAEFVSLDGVVTDPDGAEGTEGGGWAFRHGPVAIAGDKFRLGELFDTGALLMGGVTWRKFAAIWPSRTDEFSTLMNRIPKLVVSRSIAAVDAWSNSALLRGDLVEEVARRKETQVLVVVGSLSVARTLMAHDLVDEYRLLTFPTVVGGGRRLFGDGAAPLHLELEAAERVGPAVLTFYRRPTHSPGHPGREGGVS